MSDDHLDPNQEPNARDKYAAFVARKQQELSDAAGELQGCDPLPTAVLNGDTPAEALPLLPGTNTTVEELPVLGNVQMLDIPIIPKIHAIGMRPDKLRQMFKMQAELNLRVGVDTEAMQDDDAEKAKWVLNYCRAMSQELAELTDCVPWKWWAKYQTFDWQNARVEVVDLFHFLISLAQVTGMTADDLFDTYKAKMEINHKRQDSGYTTKDEDDCREI